MKRFKEIDFFTVTDLRYKYWKTILNEIHYLLQFDDWVTNGILSIMCMINFGVYEKIELFLFLFSQNCVDPVFQRFFHFRQ